MNTFHLTAAPRIAAGKKALRDIRKHGDIPAVLYGQQPVNVPYNTPLSQGEKIVNIENQQGIVVTDLLVSNENVRKLIYTPYIYLVELDIQNGKKVNAIIQDIQFHPVSDQILHIDFLQVFDNKPIVMEVPVELTGHAEGVRAGGKLNLEIRKLKVKALYQQIPEKLSIDVEKLGLGKAIKVSDLHYDNLELINAKNAVVCAVKLTRAAKGMEAAAAAATA
jgi:large subunit ribosomal protein L25